MSLLECPYIRIFTVYVQETFLSRDVQFYTFGDGAVLTIVVPRESTGNILLDGKAIPALQYKRIPNTSIYFYEQFISNSAMRHTVSTAMHDQRYYYLASVVLSSGKGYTVALDLPVNA